MTSIIDRITGKRYSFKVEIESLGGSLSDNATKSDVESSLEMLYKQRLNNCRSYKISRIGSFRFDYQLLDSYSTKPYLTLIRSSFSSIGSAARKMKITVAAAWIRSMGRPET